jgi:hypothetical protein
MRLTHVTSRPKTLDLVRLVQCGQLLPAGAPGAPAWDADRRALLFASLESRWPIGAMLAWIPSGDRLQRWYLLDGHRRIATLSELIDEHVNLVRDLSAVEPTYLPAMTAATGVYLPVNAMLLTMQFLAATHGLPEEALDLAEQAAAPIVHAQFDIATVLAGTPDEVAALCHRLLPGRVDAAILDKIAAQDATARYRLP